MARTRSKTVDDGIKQTWARIATHLANRAVVHADCDRYSAMHSAMSELEEALDLAGAQATYSHFRVPG